MAKKKKREIKKKKKKREMKRERKRESKKKSFDELPEPIIQHILSFLPEKDAIKTSILSKAWLSAWRTKPNLEFNYKLFFDMEMEMSETPLFAAPERYKTQFGIQSSEKKEKGCKEFSKYIKRTLERYNQQKISIETLKLDLIVPKGTLSYSQVDSLVERCTLVAVERGVRNLDLSASYHELPRFVVGAKSLEDLRLVEFEMLHLSTERIMWHSLKRLCLDRVCVDEVMFENIISSCPLLEDLEISYCTLGECEGQFKVMEHHNLKELDVSLFTYQFLILGEAPKLESLICKIYHFDNCDLDLEYEIFEDYDWRPCWISLHSSQYQNLKMLDLCAVGISDDFFNNFQRKFPHLQDLLLQYCQSLRRIEISSPSLERIHFVENYKLEEAHCDVPKIELFEYVCYNCKIIPEFSFSTATKCHWISNLWICWREDVDTPWFLQLKKLLVNLIPPNIFLHIEIDGSIEFDTNEIRGSRTFGEPQELQELCLVIDSESIHSSSSILSALDGFFSICRPNGLSQLNVSQLKLDHLNLICQLWPGIRSYEDDLATKLFYDIIILRTNHDHQQIKCWQHDLRQAKVQIYCYGSRRIGNTSVYLQKELVDEQQEDLDWESILEILRIPFRERIIHFALNWKKKEVPKEAKELSEVGWIAELITERERFVLE